jgi:hypothetical protein
LQIAAVMLVPFFETRNRWVCTDEIADCGDNGVRNEIIFLLQQGHVDLFEMHINKYTQRLIVGRNLRAVRKDKATMQYLEL